MAADKRASPRGSAEPEEKKRKKTASAQRKLLPGEEVEVFCADEGLNGSWHAGVVIGHESGSRVIEYANILNENSSSNLVEKLSVSDAVEGRPEPATVHYRGNIRPVPPHIELSELNYGRCVDAMVHDAWWEGAVFDDDESSAKRKIFFPDLGDQDVVGVDLLRPTQEWDENSGHWKERGDWVLLQVLQEFELKDGLPVSIRQIWYDLRSTLAFKKMIGVWTSGSRFVWHGLVSELIEELLSVINGQFSAKPIAPNRGVTKDLSSIGCRDIGMDNAGTFSRPDTSADCGKLTLLQPGGSELNPEPNVCSHVLSDFISEHKDRYAPWFSDSKKRYRALRVIARSHLQAEGWKFRETISGQKFYYSPYGKRFPSLINACSTWKQVEQSRNYQSKCCGRCIKPIGNLEYSWKNKDEVSLMPGNKSSWLPIELEPEYCSELIPLHGQNLKNIMSQMKILNPKKSDPKILRSKLMRHLLALSWKIQVKKDKNQMFRFITPEGKIHYSLCKACCALRDRKERTDGGCRKVHASDGNSLKCNPPRKFTKTYCGQAGYGPVSKTLNSDSLLVSGITEASSSGIHEEKHKYDVNRTASRKVKMASGCRCPRAEDIEPENIPEAIQDYVQYIDSKRKNAKHEPSNQGIQQMRLNAKKHLLFMKWRLWMKEKGTKRELCYDSPHSRSYISLYTACKAYLEESAEGTIISSGGCTYKKKSSSHTSTDALSANSIIEDVTDLQEEKQVLEEAVAEGFTFASGLSEFEDSGAHRQGKEGTDALILSIPFDASKNRLSNECHSRHPQSKTRASQKYTSGRHGAGTLSSSQRVLRSSKRSQPVALSPGLHVARTVLSWLIDNGVILPRQKVCYVRKRDGRMIRKGRITRDGIKCDCCQKVFSMTNFEAHAGSTSNRPAANLFLQDGRSLLQCLIKMIPDKKANEFPHMRVKTDYSCYESDSVCSVCQDGGDIVLCDYCPSSFHLGCVGLEELPEGKWGCPSCQCGICGLSELNSDAKQFTEKTILYCDQCEREYHVGCLRQYGSSTLGNCPTGVWFCSKKCSGIFRHFCKILGKSNPISREGLSWTVLRAGLVDNVEMKAEHHSKLCVALDILHECFVTMIEPRTQSDFVADLLFNKESELKRLNFWGFYTIILEKEDEVISVATLRVLGEKVAEMPLIGTCVQYRRKGMCRLLVDELEKLLIALGVERLLLPAVPQLLETWTTSFGFHKMPSSERLKLLDYGVLNFQDTIMCQKILTTSVTSLMKPIGNGNNLVQDIDQVNRDNYSHMTEVLETLELPNVLLPPVNEACTFLGEDDSVKERGFQINAAVPLPFSDCLEPEEQIVQAEANEHVPLKVENDLFNDGPGISTNSSDWFQFLWK